MSCRAHPHTPDPFRISLSGARALGAGKTGSQRCLGRPGQGPKGSGTGQAGLAWLGPLCLGVSKPP